MEQKTSWLRELVPHAVWDGIKEAMKLMLPFLAGFGIKEWTHIHATALMWTGAFVVAAAVTFWDHLPALKSEVSRQREQSRPVDLRGEILELYFHKENDLLSFPSRITVVMKVRMVNHGPNEATITHRGLNVSIGSYRLDGALAKDIPESWRIKQRKDGLINMAYTETRIEPVLGVIPESEIYRKGVPRIGWLAFDFYCQDNIEFPNAEFNLLFTDSLGGNHRIQKQPDLYRKTGEIVIGSATAATAT